MSDALQAVEELLEDSDFTLDELYVHIPSTGKAKGPHIELEGDYTHTQIPNDLNRDLMQYVDTDAKQPATKHPLANLL